LQIFEKAKSKKEAKGQDIAELQKDIDELHIKVADLKQNFDRASSSREQLVAKRMEYEMVKAELTECRKIKKLIS
jgi:FtsZ-binding cell division protein ZapB